MYVDMPDCTLWLQFQHFPYIKNNKKDIFRVKENWKHFQMPRISQWIDQKVIDQCMFYTLEVDKGTSGLNEIILYSTLARYMHMIIF